MAAYAIVNLKEITDPESFKKYGERVPAVIEKHGGRYLVRGGEHETVEGDWQPGRVVVLEFPDMAALKGWYDADDYRELKNLRHGSSVADMILVEGV